MNTSIKDQPQRIKALDIAQSFIIQAPAGSGKTELLTQRFLVLLATAQVPEEIVAITFTRKAATEMRARIFDALEAAKKTPPEKQHALQTWQLAKKVLERDQAANWNLLKNPNRLRIFTIDALCARIARFAPLISNFGTAPKVLEDAHTLYQEAAHRLLNSLEDSSSWVKALQTLLLHLDNNYLQAENLFVNMLARRDQWLSHIMNHRDTENSRSILETGLKNIISETIRSASQQLSEKDKAELLALASFAGRMLRSFASLRMTTENSLRVTNSNIVFCADLTAFPSEDIENFQVWVGIAQLLLTTTYEWRRTVNKNCGFPSPSDAINPEEEFLFKNIKQRMLSLISRLSQNENLRCLLKEILLLPPPQYTDEQWQIINALTILLPILVAHLTLIFHEKNIVDFIAIAEGAIHALGDADNPSDIALNLDYRIKHLLVDEFQDTSMTQYRLLELLTAGWQKNDARTLFLVGDPMQSIYRFREAEVGIFLRVKKYGLGNVNLIPLTLEVNFRSQPGIVAWLNKTFVSIFPDQENIELGAIPFTASTAFSDQSSSIQNVNVQTFLDPYENQEAEYIVNIIKKIAPEKSIAVLVRSRSHLEIIIPEFKKANLSFQAIEIEKLIYSAAVQDLFALTKALSHLGDRIAWLAVLRAPWCGLMLEDLYLLTNYNSEATIWENLKSFENISLSPEAKQRLGRILPILENALSERSRDSLRNWVAYTWYALGGPACLAEPHEIQNTDAYFQLLEHFSDPALLDFELLEQKLMTAYCHATSPSANIHLMTIHKAKGLEFDVVIIPSLEKKPALDENRLLMWLERQNSQGLTDLILAPIKSLEEEYDPIYRYIRMQNSLKSQYEVCRLLYVAATRSKENLYLVSSIYSDENKNECKTPVSGCFLHQLWINTPTLFEKQISQQTSFSENISEPQNYLQRLTLHWQSPNIVPITKRETTSFSNAQFKWSEQYLNHVGTVIHYALQKITEKKLDITFTDEKKLWQKKLFQLGVSENNLIPALKIIEKAITTMLNDPRGQWILADHQDAKNEYALSLHTHDETLHYILDRTFIDEHGTRWIIDYKTSELTDENEMLFLLNAKNRYAPQLENYAKTMQLFETRPIKLGIYFPLFSGWCEWDY